MALGSVQGYHGLVLASALYGASLGGTLYSLKMLALERLRARHFARSWALVQAAEALPILLGVPLTGTRRKYEISALHRFPAKVLGFFLICENHYDGSRRNDFFTSQRESAFADGAYFFK